MSTLEELIERLKVQSGAAGDETDDLTDTEFGKLQGAPRGPEYGQHVVVVFDDSYETDGERYENEHEEYGYIMGLPGYEEAFPDMGGIVHIPHTKGEKDDGGPVWITLNDLLKLHDVKRVVLRETQR